MFILQINECSSIDVYKKFPEGYSIISATQERISDSKKFFNDEYDRIKVKRKFHKLSSNTDRNGTPINLTGLAFSGGGIRSNAFQLGLLSGLNEREVNLIKRIDYISAVSGGAWAAGAFKAYQGDFFKDINAVVEGKIKSNNGNPSSSILLSTYKQNIGLMHNIKNFILSPYKLFFIEGNHIRENWRKMIQANYLINTDILLEDLEPDISKQNINKIIFKNLVFQRPFLILNTTHDTRFSFFGTNEERSFPFELTSDRIGTIADCGNSDYCYLLRCNSKKGFFVKTKDYSNAKLYLSHALAMSSAVTPSQISEIKTSDYLEWHLRMPKIDEIRDSYVITDGGHSENLGVIPLLERGVRNIIISDASALDEKNRLKEFDILIHHAEKLLNIKIEYSMLDRENLEKGKECALNAFADTPNGRINLYYIRMCVTDDFLNYLASDKKRYSIYNYLKLNSTHFPGNATITLDYAPELLKAYFFLGKFIAEKKGISDFLGISDLKKSR